MEQRLPALGLMIACLSVAAAPPQSAPTWAEKTFGPLANRAHDFGTVPRGEVVSHEFAVTNISAVPIEITSIKTG
jgi:hypothetical protein